MAPILLEALPAEAQHLVDKGIPQFEPERRLSFESIRPRVPIVSPLQLFLSLLGEETLESILTITNVYTLLVI